MSSSDDGRDDDSDNNSTSAAVLPPEDEDTCPCRQHYEDSGNKKKVLYLMSIGVTHNNAPLILFEMPPWSLLQKTVMHPKNADFGIEIARRAKLYKILPSPRPRIWSRKATIKWLELHPVRKDCDIEFLQSEVSRVQRCLSKSTG